MLPFLTEPEPLRRLPRVLVVALVLAFVLVVVRSFVFAAYEQSFFDSDQAVTGLMAKHLSEGRAFPLFMYGQPYMLAVEAWVTTPIFWIAGPTVAALRISLILFNLAIVALLIVELHRFDRLRPVDALVAVLFFAFAPPLTAASLVEAGGGNIEPFLYAVLLWLLRARPFWFGSVLAIGVLNREFTIFAVPALLVVQAWTGELFQAAGVRRWLVACVMFLFVWAGVQALQPFADFMGPGTRGQLFRGVAASQVDNLANRVHPVPAELPGRAVAFVRYRLPELIGARRMSDLIATQGRNWVAWPLAIALMAAIGRIAFLVWPKVRARWTSPTVPDSGAFAWYLLCVGLIAAAAYAAARPADQSVIRYFLLVLFVPIAVTAIWLALEPRPIIRRAVVGVVLVWTLLSGVDHLGLIRRYMVAHERNDIRELADAIEARSIHVAEAPYWRAYKLTFLTQERVKIAATDYIRIDEYQQLASREGDRLVRLQQEPCPGGEAVVGWYLCSQ